mgnify:CR=1 FL=1
MKPHRRPDQIRFPVILVKIPVIKQTFPICPPKYCAIILFMWIVFDQSSVRFHNLSADKKLSAVECIFSFMEVVAAKRYVAVDLYDGSLLYDFGNDRMGKCAESFCIRVLLPAPCRPSMK